MAESESARFSRLCPKCGRRVVRRITTCRCGAELPADTGFESAVDPGEEAPTSAVRATVVSGAAVVLALAFGAYWLMRIAPAGDGAARPALTAAAARSSDPTIAATAERTTAEREWEAAVSLGSAKNPTDPPPTAAAPLPPPPTAALSIEDIISRAMPAVVLVEPLAGVAADSM